MDNLIYNLPETMKIPLLQTLEYIKKSKWKKAEKVLRNLIVLYPKIIIFLFSLSFVMFEDNRIDETKNILKLIFDDNKMYLSDLLNRNLQFNNNDLESLLEETTADPNYNSFIVNYFYDNRDNGNNNCIEEKIEQVNNKIIEEINCDLFSH